MDRVYIMNLNIASVLPPRKLYTEGTVFKRKPLN